MEEKPMARLMVTETEVDAGFYKAALEGSGIPVFISGMEGSAFGAALDGPNEIEIIHRTRYNDEHRKRLRAQVCRDKQRRE